ncbi:ATP-binding protein [Cytobacillus pseudoceanisediminis]|jgi:DNA replication protein DnaC|uniref:ATP-binding protein n=1 Tax=Cytobacillus pseudoceanisediminis TaxID=3051614 RepID=UPI003CEAD71D
MTLEKTCLLAPYCSKAGEARFCNALCFPHTRLHGENGDGGLIAVANIPTKYRTSTIENLPFEKENPKAYAIIQKYGRTVVEKVDSGIGLYLFGVPSEENPKGCGNGKTTAATAIIIEYLRQRTMLEAKKQRSIDETPAFFMKMAKFQNVFNSQFRGSKDTTESNADKYQALKRKMMKCDLLVLDDIGLRGTTESLQNEIYEIIDERDTNEKATIFTSNVPLDHISEILTEQIASRIEGMTHAIPFIGRDNRKKSL